MKAQFFVTTPEFSDEVAQLVLKRLNIVAPNETWLESDVAQFGTMEETVIFIEDSIDFAIGEMLKLKEDLAKGE